MKKILWMIVLMALVCSGCKSVQEAKNFANCKYAITAVEIADYNVSSLSFDIYLTITNLNKKTAASIKKFTGKLMINDVYVADINLENIRIEAGASKLQKANVSVPTSTFTTKLLGLVSMGSATVDYHITGFAYFETPLGDVPIPVDIGRRGSNN